MGYVHGEQEAWKGSEAVPYSKLVGVRRVGRSFATLAVPGERTAQGCSLAAGSPVVGIAEEGSCSPCVAFGDSRKVHHPALACWDYSFVEDTLHSSVLLLEIRQNRSLLAKDPAS